MSRALYLMHVPWGWIKQRPHFIAEYLSENRPVDVYCPDQDLGRNKVHEQPARGISLRHFHPDAFLSRGPRPEFLDKLGEYSVIYLCSPLFYPLLEGKLRPTQVVVYDAMDDHLAFPDVSRSDFLLGLYRSTEAKLLAAATLVFASSEHLRRTLRHRHQNSRAIHCVSNGFSADDWNNETLSSELASALDGRFFNMVYAGTVSEWLDYPALLACLDTHPTVRCVLVGPLEVPLPQHPRLVHMAPVPHRDVYPLMKHADLLLLPFVDNALVQSADPVKVYEYIYSGTPALVLGYGETEKFRSYVHTYRSREELVRRVGELSRGELREKASAAQCLAFAKRHTWNVRMREQVEPLLALATVKAAMKGMLRAVTRARPP